MNERLQLKNFGPIKQLDVPIKPLTVLIGESGSGKSAVLKLLSLLRWVHKRNHLRSYFIRNGLANKNDFNSVSLAELLAMSGLEEFVKETTEIIFTIGKATYTATAKQLISPEVEEDFSLEVSSCGISAPLVLERQYTKNIGREVEVKTATASHTGVIKGVSNAVVTLEVTSRQPKPQGKGKITVTEQFSLPIEEIKEAKLKLKF